MNVSLRWLEAFLRRSLDPRDVADRLTMLGAPVDAVEAVNPGLEQLVVARVLEVAAHPNPKFTKVRMTVVDDGTGEPKVVACGAANVTPGRLYPFARVGTRVPGGKQGPLDIGARAIGGVTSPRHALLDRRAGPGRRQRGHLGAGDRCRPRHSAPGGDPAGRPPPGGGCHPQSAGPAGSQGHRA